jgi:two-component system NtrC family sensor kinase
MGIPVKKTATKVKKPPPKDIETIQSLQKLFNVVERGKFMWESTFDAILDPVIIVGGDFHIIRANLAAARRSGRTIQELVGRRCFEAFAGRPAICPHCPLEETLRTGSPRSVAIDGMMAEGDFMVNSYPLVSQRGGGEGPLAAHHYRDVTEENRLQRKLIQSEKMAAIGMLAGGVAHEINNPLAGILAFAQLLKNEFTSPDAQSDLNEIEQAAKRCKKIVEDLLLFARPHGESEQRDISLADTVEQILPLSKLNLKHRNVTITTQYEGSLPPVRGISARLQQVFLNLINNAAQSMEGGGEVGLRIFSGRDRAHVVAEVQDRGCGIRMEDKNKIFDPFYTTKGRHEGTGLGLSICYSIIAEHGGKMEVESEVGVGSVFRIILPAVHL